MGECSYRGPVIERLALAVSLLVACSGEAPDAPVAPSQDELSRSACHPLTASNARGAYFRKIVSNESTKYAGLHVTGVLPQVWFDGDRWFSTKDAGLTYQNGPLDRPSVYVGGRASGTEVDAGLTWDRVYDATGRASWTDVAGSRSDGGDPSHRFYVEADGTVRSETGSVRATGLADLRENFAFRPYWRVSQPDNTWHNPQPGTPDNIYLYPGADFRMQIRTAGANRLRLDVTAADGSSFGVTFAAQGWGTGAGQQFKRVHSIDQFTVQNGKRVGLESRHSDVLPTSTHLDAIRWEEARLLAADGSSAGFLDCQSPALRGTDAVFGAGYATVFRSTDQDSNGAETGWVTPPTN